MFTEGIKLEIRIGKNVPAPAPFELAEALQQVEVNHNEEGHSGFELNFQAGRCGKGGLQEYPLLDGGLLEPLNRVILVVTIRSIPYILMDGIITRHQLLPRSTDGESSLVVIGEDVSLMMDMNERPAGHVSMNDREIVESILGSSDYSQYGIVSEVSDPPTSENPDPDERTPTQRNTDLRYLRELAGRHGFVFYIVPGPGSGQNTAYWGPTRQEGVPQRPLSVNMGPFTNVEQINFNYNVLSPTRVTGSVQDRESNEPATLGASSEKPALSSRGLKRPGSDTQRLGSALGVDHCTDPGPHSRDDGLFCRQDCHSLWGAGCHVLRGSPLASPAGGGPGCRQKLRWPVVREPGLSRTSQERELQAEFLPQPGGSGHDSAAGRSGRLMYDTVLRQVSRQGG